MAKSKRKPKAARKSAKRKPARKIAKKAVKKKAPARKKAPAKRKPAARKKVAAKVVAPPLKSGIARSASPRPATMEVKLKYAEPEPDRLPRVSRPQAAMPVPVSSEHPIAPANLRPAPVFERVLPPHDDEE